MAEHARHGVLHQSTHLVRGDARVHEEEQQRVGHQAVAPVHRPAGRLAEIAVAVAVIPALRRRHRRGGIERLGGQKRVDVVSRRLEVRVERARAGGGALVPELRAREPDGDGEEEFVHRRLRLLGVVVRGCQQRRHRRAEMRRVRSKPVDAHRGLEHRARRYAPILVRGRRRQRVARGRAKLRRRRRKSFRALFHQTPRVVPHRLVLVQGQTLYLRQERAIRAIRGGSSAGPSRVIRRLRRPPQKSEKRVLAHQPPRSRLAPVGTNLGVRQRGSVRVPGS